VTSQCAINQGK